MRECAHCHGPIDWKRRDGARFCCDQHADKAGRRRRARLPEDYEHGRRGRLRLGQPTKHERLLERASRDAYERGRVEGARQVIEEAAKQTRERPVIEGRPMRRHDVDELGIDPYG